jgi:prephenate dehydrogenase
MTELKLLPKTRIAMVGLGLMGGSLAMALKDKCLSILGIDTNIEAIQYALDKNIIDQGSTVLDTKIQNADLIILAVPVQQILRLIQELPTYQGGKAIVMDIGSTKREITSSFNSLPERFDPIGCHPMCGKENLTIHNADPVIFKNATFAITPLERTSKEAISLAYELADTIGSQPLQIDPETHDHWTGATSHLPYLISLALAISTPNEVAPLVGPGFKSTVRLAGTPKSMMLDILQTNRDEVLQHCRSYMTVHGGNRCTARKL